MTLAIVHSRAVYGATAPQVTVECHLANGLPGFTIVGLPEAEVRESRDRVRAALQQCGFEFPARRITVNLAPADLPKNSGRFDLPIALGILAADGHLPAPELNRYECVGELSLTGAVNAVRGILSMTLASQSGASPRTLLVPAANCAEARLVTKALVKGAANLSEAIRTIKGFVDPSVLEPLVEPTAFIEYESLSDVKGQDQAKLALEIAAAGQHHLLLTGPPGSGKSMLANRLPGLLPAMTQSEAIEAAAIKSLRGEFDPKHWMQRPFRAPHHGASSAALVGGGAKALPGEISLAHHGVLFLDELPEFQRHVLETLREPLETGSISIARANHHVSYPARFQLVAAMNPCPCGYLGQTRCRCRAEQVERYQSRVSGPLLDRIDLQVKIEPVQAQVLTLQSARESNQPSRSEPANEIAEIERKRRIQRSRGIQLARQGVANGRLVANQLDQYLHLTDEAAQMAGAALARFNWTARTYHRILRTARTVADLQADELLRPDHLAQALQFRLQ